MNAMPCSKPQGPLFISKEKVWLEDLMLEFCINKGFLVNSPRMSDDNAGSTI